MRFYIALWFSKFYLLITDTFCHKKSDRVGLIAARICPNMLEKLKKPELVIMVTGTNGKTTVTDMVANMLMHDGKKVVYNYWGANQVAGHIRSLLDTVNIFNKSTVDICVLECDEITTVECMPQIKPNYMLVTNLCRDSIRRNAYPDYIFGILDKGLGLSKDTILIVNAMDPLSSFLGENNKRIFVSADKIFNEDAYEGFSPEFKTCPRCNSVIEYEYRHYRHMGKFVCPNCGLKNFPGDYVLNGIKQDNIIVNSDKYAVVSSSIFNIYNETMIIALFSELGYKPKKINELLKTIDIPSSREGYESYKGIEMYRRCGKAQNGTAPSMVFESILKDKRDKELILIMDEDIYFNAQETITWLYDNDFELLTDKSVKKIIITGRRTLDFKLRLLLAKVDRDKLFIAEDYKDAYKYLSLDDSIVYIVHDVDSGNAGKEVIQNIKDRMDGVIE